MKRFFIIFSFIFISLLSFIPNSYALTEDEQDHLDFFLSKYYDIDNYPKCIFSYKLSSSTSKSVTFCFSDEISSKIKFSGKVSELDPTGLVVYKSNVSRHVIRLEKTLSTNTFTSDFSNTATVPGMTYSLSELYATYYNNFDIYNNSDSTLYKEKDISFTPPAKYTISFIIPSGSTLEVKDDTGNILEPISDYKYSLTEGHYSYSVYKEGFYSKENIDFTVTSDSTINVELENKFNPNNMQSIFTQYYNYIRDLVNDLFPLENPLFLFVVTFIIGFSIMALIKKLVGGLF